jgi:hypothetical protein
VRAAGADPLQAGTQRGLCVRLRKLSDLRGVLADTDPSDHGIGNAIAED